MSIRPIGSFCPDPWSTLRLDHGTEIKLSLTGSFSQLPCHDRIRETVKPQEDSMNLKHFLRFFLLIFSLLFFSQHIFAELRLEIGSHYNRTHMDMAMGRANLNFIYRGCDRNPNPSDIKLNVDGNCKLARDHALGQSGGSTSRSGMVGDILATYTDKNPGCTTKVTRRIHINKSLRDVYNQFQAKGCTPAFLVIKDGTGEGSKGFIKDMNNKGLCTLPDTRISKPGFPTENFPFFNLTATDKGFKIGDHTKYEYDHNNKVWCVQYRNNPKKCGQWPSPLPMAYKDSGDSRFQVRGVVELGNDGKASIRAINKSYATQAELFEAQKRGEFENTDTSKGRIDYQTWRKPNGLVRAIARSYTVDSSNATHQRSVNFFARNMFGIGITNTWCPGEHCFADVTEASLQASKCSDKPIINMTNGGNGNVCQSCIGITPGQCAIEKPEVDFLRTQLTSDFPLTPQGEYRFGQNINEPLMKNFNRIVANPKTPGCQQGYAPAFDKLFDPGEALRETGEGRSVQQKNESL